MSVSACIALLKAEVERKRTPTPIISWPVRGSSPLTCSGIPAGGHGLLPQVQARERAAHTGTVSEQCLEPNRARFSRQLKRLSVLMDSVVRISTTPASQSVSNGLQMKVAHVIEGIGYGELHARLSLIWNLTGGQKKPIMHTQIIGSWRLAKIIS